jgi:hypothetical protein
MYEVGQVLYVVFNKENKIVPVLVVEEITKKTLSGSETMYRVKLGDANPTIATLQEINGEVFESAEDAKRVLINRLTAGVNRLIDAAKKRAVEWYGQQPQQRQETIHQPVVAIEEERPVQQQERVRVTMPDGTVANVVMPNEFR